MSLKTRMPWSVRAFTAVYSRINGRDYAGWTPDDIAAERAKVLPTKPPVSLVTGPVAEGVSISPVTVPMRDGTTIPASVLRPAGLAADAPVLIYYHGGGWTLSNPGNYAALTSFLAVATGAVVVAPDYRKAPQAKAPQATYDAYDTLAWVGSRPTEVGASGPIAVAGDSAGGNLSALVSLLARDLNGPAIAGQGLIYPATDLTRSHPSASWRDEAILTGESMDFFLDSYLSGAQVTGKDPLVSPLWAASHADLPPALIQTAECDPLVDEGEHYAEVLRAAGIPTRLTRYRGMPHGFVSFPGVTGGLGRQAWDELAQSLREWFAGTPAKA